MKHDLFIVRHRKWFIALPVVMAVLMLLPLMKAHINSDLMNYLPEDMVSKVNLDRLEAVFGKYDPVLVLFSGEDVLRAGTLERMRLLDQTFRQSDKIDQVISLFELKNIRSEAGSMVVDPVVQSVPNTVSEREILRQSVRTNPLVYKLLVSKDFKHCLMLVNPAPKVPDKELALFIRRVLKQYPGPEQVLVSGQPTLRYEIQRIAMRDLMILMPLGLIIMLLTLFLSFREQKGVLLPFSVVCMSIAVAMGLMPLLGFDFSLIAVLVPVLMIAIANNYGVHLITRYQELNAVHPRWGMKRIVNESVRKLYTPIILTALTTIVGVLGLLSHLLIPPRQMGIVTAAGILFALLTSLTFIPAVMSGVPKGQTSIHFGEKPTGWMGHFLAWTGRVSTGKPWMVILVFMLLVAGAGVGFSRLQVAINLEEMMPASSDLRQTMGLLNDHFGGTKSISVLFTGDIKSPRVLKEIDSFEKRAAQLPEVSNVTSLATVIHTISRSMNNPGMPGYDRIPEERQAIAQYLELYTMGGDLEDLERLVDFDYTNSVATVQFKAENFSSFKQTESGIRAIAATLPSCRLIAGQSLVEETLSAAIIKGQISSLLFAMGAIIFLLWLIFRSFKAGLMGAIPLVVSLVANFGLMGWIGLRLDIATSLLSSIAIGLGVDYTIHLFWRINHELQHGKDWEDAIAYTLRSTGRGIAVNAFSVMAGFAVLLFSGLTILKAFGYLIIFSLLLCLLCALVLIPAILQLNRPSFLLKSTNAQL